MIDGQGKYLLDSIQAQISLWSRCLNLCPAGKHGHLLPHRTKDIFDTLAEKQQPFLAK
jgi:hypothetical protein